MSTELEAALKTHFGYGTFKAGQREVIEHLVAGRSAAAVFPTGGGKSLCYQLPAMMLEGLTIVVSPLIALMKDQIDVLRSRDIAAARLDSTLGGDEYRAVMDQVRAGRLRMLYVAPERFVNERFREAMRRVAVSLFAVDEAHCVSEWGHNFRPDYLKLARYAALCGAQCTLALTATATEKVLEDICRGFDIDSQCAVRTGFYRPNLKVLTRPVQDLKRDGFLLDLLHTRPAGPTIVYVTLQRTAEEVAEMLADHDLPARPYHAGMDDESRAKIQDWFLASDRGIVVATIAFGMGIDKSNIRYVYHYNLPKSLENYSQEIGRAGRDGEPATCQMFVCADDIDVLENFVYGDTPSLAAVKGLLRGIFSSGESFDVSIHELSSKHDIRVLVVRTLLTYLELLGYLEGGTPFYSTFQFKPLMSSALILDQFAGEHRTFLAQLFKQARAAKIWFHLDVDRAAAQIGSDRKRVVRALDYLGERQMLEVRSAGVRYRYRRLKMAEGEDALAESLYQRTIEREKREIERLHQVLELVVLDGCQVAALSGHFGQKLSQPCGHCSWCVDQHRPQSMPARAPRSINNEIWRDVAALQREHPDLLSDPRAVTRLLCGVTSPKLTRAKLNKQRLFAALADMPFQDVLTRVTANA